MAARRRCEMSICIYCISLKIKDRWKAHHCFFLAFPLTTTRYFNVAFSQMSLNGFLQGIPAFKVFGLTKNIEVNLAEYNDPLILRIIVHQLLMGQFF